MTTLSSWVSDVLDTEDPCLLNSLYLFGFRALTSPGFLLHLRKMNCGKTHTT